MKTKLFLALLMTLLITACNNPSVAPTADWVAPTSIQSPTAGGEYVVRVSIEQSWTATPQSSWIGVTPKEGTGETDVTIKVYPNSWAEDDTTSVLFSNGESTAEVIVYRKGRGEGAITVAPSSLWVNAAGGEYEIQVTSGVKWMVNSNVSWLTYTPGVGQNNGIVKVTILPATSSEQKEGILTIYAVGDNTNKAELSVTRLGMEKKYFSVSETKQVYFSPGNLQYQVLTDSWRFAENQYDYVGEDNKNISSASYLGWIDLFGFGTGDNPTQSSTDNSDYAAFTDWGVNKISNATDDSHSWRTMTLEEWEYLFSSRTNAPNLHSQATANNVQGYILLPDNWMLPGGLSFTANANDWTTNTYSSDDWTKMELNGAVFLPAAGSRNGTDMYEIANNGIYWSSSSDGDSKNYSNAFYFSSINAKMDTYYRKAGLSVRLVQDAE